MAKFVNYTVFLVLVSRCGCPNTQTTASSHVGGSNNNTSYSQQQ
jgi:hypothetical protein